jgi:arsenite methyltransferase
MANLLKIKEKVKERYGKVALTGESCYGPSVSFESGGGCCSGNNNAVLQPLT